MSMIHASCHSADAWHTPSSHWVSQHDSEAMSPPTALNAIIDDGFALLRSSPSDKVVLVERGDETFVVKCAKTKETCHHEEAILSHLASTKEVKLSSGCEILTGPALENFSSDNVSCSRVLDSRHETDSGAGSLGPLSAVFYHGVDGKFLQKWLQPSSCNTG
jgi:hypothetical protein